MIGKILKKNEILWKCSWLLSQRRKDLKEKSLLDWAPLDQNGTSLIPRICPSSAVITGSAEVGLPMGTWGPRSSGVGTRGQVHVTEPSPYPDPQPHSKRLLSEAALGQSYGGSMLGRGQCNRPVSGYSHVGAGRPARLSHSSPAVEGQPLDSRKGFIPG